MDPNAVLSSLVSAQITIEDLQTVGGFLIEETNRDEFAEEFVQQVMHQCAAQHYNAMGDNDAHQTVEFEVPIAHVCYIAATLANVAKRNPHASPLMLVWKPFIAAAQAVIETAIRERDGRRYDELGPESMN